MPPARRNTQPRYNICPPTNMDTVIEREGKRELVPMRWGLIPSWWSKRLNFATAQNVKSARNRAA
jgi:putative SOS response-associated peptidase YedK